MGWGVLCTVATSSYDHADRAAHPVFGVESVFRLCLVTTSSYGHADRAVHPVFGFECVSVFPWSPPRVMNTPIGRLIPCLLLLLLLVLLLLLCV